MELYEYEEAAMRTAKDMGSAQMNLIHSALLIGSEGGEFQTSVKAYSVYGKVLDKKNCIEELGDLLWGIALACKTLNVSMEDVAAANIEKLRLRYPNGYNDQDAKLRWDKVGGMKHIPIPEEGFDLSHTSPMEVREKSLEEVIDNREDEGE